MPAKPEQIRIAILDDYQNVSKRKLAAVELKFGKSEFEKKQYALLGLMCTYGIELLPDNIAECRANMLEVSADYPNPDGGSTPSREFPLRHH